MMAASMASAPELAKKTPDPAGAWAIRRRASASSIWAGVVKKLETWIAAAAWRVIASTRAGWLWPRVLTAMPPMRSR